jgi:hypothetical protein
MKTIYILVLTIILIILIMILNSCAPAYIPNVVNAPMLQKKGDIQLNLNTGISGFDPQTSYAISNNIGIMLNGSFSKWNSNSTENFRRHNFVEIGGGYFKGFGDIGIFETYTGAGFGNISANYENELWSDNIKLNNMRLFVQSGIGISTNIIDACFSPRFTYVKLYQNSNSEYSFFIEPVISIKLGYKYIKAVLQAGLALPIQKETGFNYQPLIVSVGIQSKLNWSK